MKINAFVRLGFVLLCLCLLAACGESREPAPRPEVISQELQFAGVREGDPIAVISTSLGEIDVVLYPGLAPMAVDNFIGLAQQGYYNGSTIHTTLFGSYIQGGDATGTGYGSATIWNADSFPLEACGSLRHYSGAFCVAFDRDTQRGTSQFYIVTAPAGNVEGSMLQKLAEAGYSESAVETYKNAGGLPQLDNTDTVFGQVYQGLNIADEISAAELGEDGRPKEPVVINTITITTYTENHE